MTVFDCSDKSRRHYTALDKDKLEILGDIAVNIECLNDSLSYSVEPLLERIAAALERMAGSPAADTDKNEPAADTPMNNA